VFPLGGVNVTVPAPVVVKLIGVLYTGVPDASFARMVSVAVVEPSLVMTFLSVLSVRVDPSTWMGICESGSPETLAVMVTTRLL